MNLELLAGRIRERRIARHITQAELAHRLGITPQTVSKWERGLCAPDLDNLIDLAAMLSCSVDHLLSAESGHLRRSFIAVDGGGTKTETVIATMEGEIVSRYIGGPSSVSGQSTEKALAALEECICKVIEPLGIDKTDLTGYYAGISGGG